MIQRQSARFTSYARNTKCTWLHKKPGRPDYTPFYKRLVVADLHTHTHTSAPSQRSLTSTLSEPAIIERRLCLMRRLHPLTHWAQLHPPLRPKLPNHSCILAQFCAYTPYFCGFVVTQRLVHFPRLCI